MLSSTLNQHVSHLEESRQQPQPTAKTFPGGKPQFLNLPKGFWADTFYLKHAEKRIIISFLRH